MPEGRSINNIQGLQSENRGPPKKKKNHITIIQKGEKNIINFNSSNSLCVDLNA